MKRLLLFFVLSLSSFSFYGQQIDLFTQFNGRYDYTAIGNTLNEFPNSINGYCDILTESSANLTLLPNQTLVSAMLYWSGSAVGDFEVKLNGIDISAQRTFSHNFNGLPYFAAYADVTSIVESEGNGTYTFSDMDILSTLSQYCGTNYGGWSIIVVYEDPSLLLNQVAIFDGLESVSANNNILDITLTDINAISDHLSKIGFLAWEGEEFIAVSESLFINGNLMQNPPLNPSDNAFNNTNSYTNSNQLYNMDLDYYDLQGIVNPGDTQMNIQLTSQQDFIMVNNIITVVNSELPDATVVIDGIVGFPQQNEIEITYTVSNINSTNVLPIQTPVSFYAEDILMGEDLTDVEIPINSTHTKTVRLPIPENTPSHFILKAVIDAGGIIPETNESNNEFETQIILTDINININPSPLTICDTNNDGFETFDLSIQTPIITLGDPNLIVSYHKTLLDAENAQLSLPNFYMNDQIYLDVPITDSQNPLYGTGGVWARISNASGSSVAIVAFVLEVRSSPVGNTPTPLRKCDDTIADGLTIFDLTVVATEVLGSLDPLGFDLYYYDDLAAATAAGDLAATNPDFSQAIPNSTNFLNTTNPQDIYVLLVSNANGTIPPNPNSSVGCYDIVTLSLQVLPNPNPNPSPDSLVACDDDSDGIFSGWDLTLADADIINGEPDVNILYWETLAEAQAGIPGTEIVLPYTNVVPFSQIVYARVAKSVPPAILPCYAIVELELIVNEIPPITQPINLFINEGDGDGFAIFDLTVNIPVMLGGLNPSDYEVSFYITEIDAQNDTNRLINTTTFLNTSNPQTIFVRVENLNTSCFKTASFEIETDEELSVDSFTFGDLEVYPNPTSESFTIQSSQLVLETTISLYDIQGKLLFSEKMLPQNGKLKMNVSSLENGVYFIKISSEGNSVFKKVVKN